MFIMEYVDVISYGFYTIALIIIVMGIRNWKRKG